jgi:Calcineurin-like phosphoesterase
MTSQRLGFLIVNACCSFPLLLSFRLPLRSSTLDRIQKLVFFSTQGNTGIRDRGDPYSFTAAILGDLHLDPRYMGDYENGRRHFEPILKDKNGNPRPNTCVVSLGDLGESKSISPETTSELFAGTTACFKLAREYLDGFAVPFEVVGGNHDLEGIDEFPTDQANLEAYLRILGKPTPQFKRLIAEKTMLVGLGSTVFRNAQYTSHEVFIDDEQV